MQHLGVNFGGIWRFEFRFFICFFAYEMWADFSERELTSMFTKCYRPSVCLSYVVCNVRAPYSSHRNFWQCFYAIWYLGHQ